MTKTLYKAMTKVKKEAGDNVAEETVSGTTTDRLSRMKRKMDKIRHQMLLVKTDLRIMKKKNKMLEQRVKQLQQMLDRQRAGCTAGGYDPVTGKTQQVVHEVILL